MTDALGRPIADPSALTTAALLREVELVKDMLDAEARVRQSEQEAHAKQTDIQLSGLGDIMEEKFNSVYEKFTMVEKQRVEQKVDTKDAVDAALIAQKEAVKEQTIASEKGSIKSETAASEQAKQSDATFQAAISGLNVIIGDIKDRVISMESNKQGGKEAYAAIYALVGFFVSLLVLGGALAASGAFTKA